MKPQRSAVPALVATLSVALGCATVHVAQDFDEARGIPPFQTFHVMQPLAGEGPRTDPRVVTPFTADRIERAIHTELVRRGYRPASRESADILIGFHFDSERRLDVRTVNSGFGFRTRRFGGFGSSTQVIEYEEGTLSIDIAERESMMLAWRGWGSARLGRRPTPQRITQRINEIVPEILAQLPPTPSAV